METVATREIMWNIPFSFKIIMYVLMVISLYIMVKGIREKLAFAAGTKSWKGIKKALFPEKLQLGALMKSFIVAGKVHRSREAAFFHALIFYGFVVLWIATDLVAIHYDTPFKVFKGTTYIVVSFLADIAGLTILIGIALAFHRRYIKKPEYLKSSKPKQELFMYGMLIALVVIGFLIEGLRIAGTGMPEGESRWSPVGWFIATGINRLALSDSAMALTYRTLWFLHMANTMVFIASIGYSKFFHIFALPFTATVTPPRRGAVLNPMSFEDEEAETFGLGKFSELTAKNKLDLVTCIECGRCTNACPANLAGKPLNPKEIITKTRDIVFKNVIVDKKEDVDFWEEGIYESNELDSCTTCGACMEECPAHIEHVNIIMEAKRYKALTLGELPSAAEETVNKIKNTGNPWGISQEDRFKWADGLEVPVIEPSKKVEYLYYVGCAGSYDGSNQQVVRDTVTLLKKAGVDFAVMGKGEKCNGDPIRRFGDEYSFFEIAIENIANLREYEFDKIVTHCPHCLHTIGKEYGKFDDGNFDVVHHTELLNDLLKQGKIKPTKEIREDVTFHDPCYLGRHHGEYNAPRDVLNAVPGLKIKEMDRAKDKSLCCGMGGGNMWYELPEGEHPAKNRLRDIAETNTKKTASACSYCLINFNSTKAQVKETENLVVEDVATILNKSVE